MFTGPLFEMKRHLVHTVLLKGFQSSSGALKSTIPGKFHGSCRQSNANCLRDWTNFSRLQAWQIVLIVNTELRIYNKSGKFYSFCLFFCQFKAHHMAFWCIAQCLRLTRPECGGYFWMPISSVAGYYHQMNKSPNLSNRWWFIKTLLLLLLNVVESKCSNHSTLYNGYNNLSKLGFKSIIVSK